MTTGPLITGALRSAVDPQAYAQLTHCDPVHHHRMAEPA